jgi:hypothetical protein
MAFDKTEADTNGGLPANGVADGKMWNIKPIPSASTSVP